MEKITKHCLHCHQALICKRNPKQSYCAKPICQNARKREWRKRKLVIDSDYRQNQQCADKNWRRRHPDYWKKYRESHPIYTTHNRKQQCLRQQQRRLKKFAKSDALTEETSIKAGTYRMVPVPKSEFAKSDALIVTIAVLSRS